MRLLLAILAIGSLTGCSKHFVTTSMMKVDVAKQDSWYVVHSSVFIESEGDAMAIAIHAAYYPNTWGEIIEPFKLDVFVTATPSLDVSSEENWLHTISLEPLNQTYTISSDEFFDCQGVMTYGLGHVFPPLIPEEDQHLYVLSHSFEVHQE